MRPRLLTILLLSVIVFALARIRSDGSDLRLSSPAAQRILAHCTRAWAERLDCIVHLDADDEGIYERIHGREQSHRLRGEDKHKALAFFDGYRTARGPAGLIQAQRDYFGAHTFERVDRPRREPWRSVKLD